MLLKDTPERILAAAPEVIDLGLRLRYLCLAAGVSFAEIERERGLSRNSISAYVSGQLYAYPKLKRLVVEHLAEALSADPADVSAYLFPPADGAKDAAS